MVQCNFIYQVGVSFIVAHSRPGGYEEPCCLEGLPCLGEQSSDVGTSPVEQTSIGCFSVVDSASIARCGVHISPVGSKKWWASTHWEWIGCKTSHGSIKRDWSIVVDL